MDKGANAPWPRCARVPLGTCGREEDGVRPFGGDRVPATQPIRDASCTNQKRPMHAGLPIFSRVIWSAGSSISGAVTIHDPTARLWAQAERVRAYQIDRRARGVARVGAAIKGLRRFLRTPTPGLWFDQLTADNRLIAEPGARAKPLSYHRRRHRTGSEITPARLKQSANGRACRRCAGPLPR